MQRLDILLLNPFDRHKVHVRATHRLADRFRIRGIMLITLDVRFHKLRTHQPDVMAEFTHLADPIMRTVAGLQPNKTRLKLGNRF
jgi:hypothetical protein